MPATHTRPKSLADDLRRRSDEELGELLRRRPDLISPAPSDMTALTTRATAGPSIARCLDTLDAVELYCLKVARSERDEWIARVPVDPADAADAIDRLRILGLVWGDPDALRVVTAVTGMLPEIAPPPATPPRVGLGAAHPIGADAGVTEVTILIDHMAVLLDELGFSPVTALRSDGIAARDLAACADTVAASAEATAFLLECASSAHLIALESASRTWIPTDRFDAWIDLAPADQWVTIADAWLRMPRTGWASDRRPLDPGSDSAHTPATRRMVLTLVGDTAPGEPVSAESVIAAAAYRFPRRAGSARDEVVRATLAETELLGLTVRGALTSFGRAWIAHQDLGLTDLLPAHVDRVITQADMTITCPGPLTTPMRLTLARFADVESRGHATVFRVTPDSVRRGVIRGAGDMSGWLREHSATPLPAPMTYLIDDVTRQETDERVTQQRITWDEPPVTVTRRNQERLIAAVVAGLRGGGTTRQDQVVMDIEPMSTGAVVTALRNAIDVHASVHIGYADASGSTIVMHIEPMRMGGGTVTAFDFGVEQVRSLTISRIAAVLPG